MQNQIRNQKKIIYLFSFVLLFIFSPLCAQEKYTTSMLLEWGHGGNGLYTQSISILGHTKMKTNLIYLDFGFKILTSPKHIKKSAITQALIGLQTNPFSIAEKFPFFLGVRGGYGWMYGKNKEFKGGAIEAFTRIKLTKHISCGYYFTYQDFGQKMGMHVNSKNHEGKIIFEL